MPAALGRLQALPPGRLLLGRLICDVILGLQAEQVTIFFELDPRQLPRLRCRYAGLVRWAVVSHGLGEGVFALQV